MSKYISKTLKRMVSLFLIAIIVIASSGFEVSAAKPAKSITILTVLEPLAVVSGESINFSISAKYGDVKDATKITWSSDLEPDGEGTLSLQEGYPVLGKTILWAFSYKAPNTTSDQVIPFTITVSDGKTSDSIDVVVNVTGSNIRPVISSISGATTIIQGESTTLDVGVTDEDSISVTLSVSPDPTYGTVTISGMTVTYKQDGDWTPSNPDSFAIIATDESGASSDPYPVMITIEADPVANNVAPVISSITGNTAILEGESTSLSVVVTDEEPSLVTLSVSSLPQYGTVTISGMTVTYAQDELWTSPDPDSFAIIATDEYGATSAPYQISITITSNSQPGTINYVVLGDSIATGTVTGNSITDRYGVPSVIDSYVDYFAAYLRNTGDEVNVADFSTDGDQSSQLLEKLTLAEFANIQTAISNADVITISIGGNNLMRAAQDDSLSGYDFDNVDLADAELGRQEFKADWPSIVAALDYLTDGEIDGAVDAKIIVNTVYNPYFTGDALYDDVDSLLNGTQGINAVINENAEIYSVADVYSAFSAYNDSTAHMNEITYMYSDKVINFFFFVVELRNPHPTAFGQSLIFDSVKAEYLN